MPEKYSKEELTDLYLRDMLDTDEKIAFEERMREDENLAREVELSRHIINAIERKGEQDVVQELAGVSSKEEAKRILSLTEAKHRVAGRRRTLWRWVGVAAAAVMIAVVIIGMQPRYPVHELYAMSYERPIYDPVISRGDPEISAGLKQMLNDAGKLYESGDMSGAAGIYDKASEQFPQSVLPDDALFYYAVTLCGTGRIEEARNIFIKLAVDPDSEYTEDAQWQSALLYLRAGERKKAMSALATIHNTGGFYATQAGELLELLKQKRLF